MKLFIGCILLVLVLAWYFAFELVSWANKREGLVCGICRYYSLGKCGRRCCSAPVVRGLHRHVRASDGCFCFGFEPAEDIDDG